MVGFTYNKLHNELLDVKKKESNNMKKLLALVLTLFIASCTPAEEPLRVAMDLNYPPFETVDTANNPEGISVDTARAFGEFLGREVEIVNTQFGSIIPAIQSGEVDIAIASMSITAERALIVDFSNPYFYFKIITLVNSDWAAANGITEDSTIEDLLAIEDARFIGIASQVSASIPQSYGKEVREATDLGTAVEQVAQGTSDVLLMSANPVIDGYRANPDTTLVVWDSWVSSPIGMAVQKGNTELIEQANEFIATFDSPGGLYEELSATWDEILLERLLNRYGIDFYINE
jgi:polar amino acid transport system substrate-binding protein